MYRQGKEYDHVDRLAIDILMDYGINQFPLDIDDLCRKMNINIVPYSAFDSDVELLLKKSKQGSSKHRTETDNPTIYFNDIYGDHLTPANIASTKAHEIKHIVDNDLDDSKDDLASHFARHLRCPIPVVIYWNIYSSNELISRFGISQEQASYVLKSTRNRCRKYGYSFFPYEVEYLRFYFNEADLELPLIEKD